MGSTIDEAVRAKAFAERQFVQKNFVGAKSYALKAQMLCPELEGISQMVATFGVYIASEAKVNGEVDFYSILGLDPSADKSKVKKQYKKMAVLLHPDKNKTVGADGAFRLVSEAWTLLSDRVKRSSYDQRRNLFGGYDNYSKFAASYSRLDTFWTLCTTCHIQYEYLRKYVNKRLSCKNCRGIFIAVETGLSPVSGSFQFNTSPCVPENGYKSHGCGIIYMPPTTTGCCAPNGMTGHHSGHRSEYVSNISFQGNSSGVVNPNGLSTPSFVMHQANGVAKKTNANGEHHAVKASTNQISFNEYNGQNEVILKPRRGRPAKKQKVELVTAHSNGHDVRPDVTLQVRTANENGTFKPPAVPIVDTKQLLINMARSLIRRKLEEMNLASEAEKRNAHAAVNESSNVYDYQPELKRRTVSTSMTVPDSDFHDFDQDRSEECFKPKQIWALYDEEDGMPRLYCLIRKVISVNPFKIHISYLSSKTDSEFGSGNWLDSGFTKSCGSFRVFSSEMIDKVNIFSHILSREKAGRGGCVRIYPRTGDTWAVYRNWSTNWNRKTPDEVRHQYEMVEVLDDYSEENGIRVTPLIKLDGFKTVYRRNVSKDAMQWIPRREMLRFSHQVPSCSLESSNLPEGCLDLDPAAIPDELLQGETESILIPKTSAQGQEEAR